MKGYIVSILIVGLALGGMGLGTFAWFTDQSIMEENVIQTGDLKLDVKIVESVGSEGEVVLKAENLVPSTAWTFAGIIRLENTGTTPLKWRGYFVKTDGDLSLNSNLHFQIGQVTDSPFGVSPKAYTWNDLKVADSTPLNSANFGGGGGQLSPGSIQYYKVEVRLDEDAGNSYMDKSATFKAIFDATQPENLGWSQTTQTE